MGSLRCMVKVLMVYSRTPPCLYCTSEERTRCLVKGADGKPIIHLCYTQQIQRSRRLPNLSLEASDGGELL